MKAYVKSRFFIVFSIFIFTIAVSCIGSTWSPKKSSVRQNSQLGECDPWKSGPQMIKLPVFSNAWQIVSECDRHEREAVTIAMIFFYKEWQHTFGDSSNSVWMALNTLLIEWSQLDKRATAHDMSEKLRYEAALAGAALTSGMIWVRPGHNVPVCETAFVHELVHIAIWSQKGTDGDPDHLGDKYTGWSVDHAALIQRVNDQLCSLSI